MRQLGWIVALAAFAGCGGGETEGMMADGGQEAVQPPQMTVEDAPPAPVAKPCSGMQAIIGSGAREFEPVKDGDTLYLYKGPQGGYMIYIGVKARGLDRSLVYVDYEERFVDTHELFGVGQWKVQLTNDVGDGFYERVGIWGEIEPEYWTRPQVVRGRDIDMRVKLTDAQGCTVEGLGWTIHVNEEKPQ